VLTRRPERRRAALRARYLGLLFQVDNLIAHLDLGTNLSVAQRVAGRDHPERRADVLERLGLGGRAHARPTQLSGGEAARAGLAVALVNDPLVVLADEPTGEVDGGTEEAVLALLRDEAAAGRAILVVTHSEAVAAAATRVVELVDGKLAA